MEDIVKDLPEVREGNIHCSFLILQAGYFITEAYQVGQAGLDYQVGLDFSEFMLIIPDDFFSSFTCLEMVSRMSYSITFPGIEMKLTGL